MQIQHYIVFADELIITLPWFILDKSIYISKTFSGKHRYYFIKYYFCLLELNKQI